MSKVNMADKATIRATSIFPAVFRKRLDAAQQHWKSANQGAHFDKQEFENSILGPEQPIIDDEWRADDEDWFMSTWEKSSSKSALETISQDHAHLLKLWKTCCKILKVSPVAIVSPRHGLVYAVESLGPEPESANNSQRQLWSEEFCKILLKLSCHSFWKADARNLTAAIQYVVICRDDDRRPWKLASSNSSCEAMQTMKEVVSSVRVRRLHDLCSGYYAAQIANGREPSLDYAFFCHLGSLVKTCATPNIANFSPHHPPALSVGVSDLEIIETALNTFSWCGYPIFSESSIMAQATKCLRSQNVFPRGKALREVHIRSFLHEARMAYREAFASKSMSRPSPQILAPLPAAVSAGATTGLIDSTSQTASNTIVIDEENETRLTPALLTPGKSSQMENTHKDHKSLQVNANLSTNQNSRNNRSRHRGYRSRSNRWNQGQRPRNSQSSTMNDGVINQGSYSSSPLGRRHENRIRPSRPRIMSSSTSVDYYPDRFYRPRRGVVDFDGPENDHGQSFRGRFSHSRWM